MSARSDVVQAINQRWLVKFWERHLHGQRVPNWQAIGAADLSAMSSNLSFFDVVRSGGALRFQYRYQGATVALVHGSGECRSSFLDEIMPAERRTQSLPAYHQAVESGRPIYTIHDVHDRDGRLVSFERLLLPFAADGHTIDRILASFELICEDGAFERRGLMTLQGNVSPSLRLAATIEPLVAV